MWKRLFLALCLEVILIKTVKSEETALLKLIENAGKEKFYKKVIINKLNVIINKYDFKYTVWETELVKLEEIKKSLPNTERLYYGVVKLIQFIKKLEMFTFIRTRPLVESTAATTTGSCSAPVDIFNLLSQDNELSRFKHIIKNLDSPLQTFTEEIKFSNVQDALRHIHSYFNKLQIDANIYQNILQKDSLNNIIHSTGGKGLSKVECLKDYDPNIYTHTTYIDTSVHNSTITSTYAILQFKEEIIMTRFKFNELENLALDGTRPTHVYELDGQFLIINNNDQPFSLLSEIIILPTACKIALELNDLKTARHSCNMLPVKPKSQLKMTSDAIFIDPTKLSNDEIDQYSPYKTIELKRIDGIELNNKYGSVVLKLNNLIDKTAHPKFTTKEVENWEELEELYLLSLLGFLPFILLPLSFFLVKNKKRKKNKREFKNERAQSLLLLRNKLRMPNDS